MLLVSLMFSETSTFDKNKSLDQNNYSGLSSLRPRHQRTINTVYLLTTPPSATPSTTPGNGF